MKTPLYVIDTETTGLSKEKSHLLQLAVVKVDDLSKSNAEFDKLNLFIKHELLTYVEPKAAQMVASTLKNMESAPKEDVLGLQGVQMKWNDFFFKHYVNGEKFVLAGKNVATFDLPILKNNGFDIYSFSHRIFDVGSMYYEDFGYIPSLDEINKLRGAENVVHDALADCWDVVDAIRFKMKK
jgi:oligoribonuclease (3'-5' exoribonuclease)